MTLRYEDFSANLVRIGAGRGIPAVGAGLSSVISATLTPAGTGASTVADQTSFSVPGVELNDIVIAVRYPTTNHTWIVKCTPTAKDTLTITFAGDATGGTPGSGTYTFLVLKTQ
jgi:hypothetical protein